MVRSAKQPLPRLDIVIPAAGWERAVQEDSARCLIAETIKEQLGKQSRPMVDMNFIRVTVEPGLRVLYPTPAVAKAVLVDFDEGILPGEDVRIRATALHVRERPSRKGTVVEVGVVREWAKTQPQFAGRVTDGGVLSSEIISAYRAEHPQVKEVRQGRKIKRAGNSGLSHTSTPVTSLGQQAPAAGSLAGGDLAPQIPDDRRRVFGDRKLTKAMIERGWTPPQKG